MRTLGILLLLACPAQAHLLLICEVVELLPNTPNQKMRVYAMSSDPADPPITGMNLQVAIGDGDGPLVEPVFQGERMEGVSWEGTIWQAHNSAASGEAPVKDHTSYATLGMIFTERGKSVRADGLVATLIVDTTGIDSGVFAVNIGGNVEPIEPSNYILEGPHESWPVWVNATITVTDEPKKRVQATQRIRAIMSALPVGEE